MPSLPALSAPPLFDHDTRGHRRAVASQPRRAASLKARPRRHAATAALFCMASLLAAAPVSAATKGFYIQADGTLSIGASQVSMANRLVGSGGGNTVFSLANDGRFGYGAAVGYMFDRAGVRLRYLALGTQPTLAIDGQTNVSRSGVASRFLGVEGMYLFPIIPKRVDLALIGGAGVMRTTVTFPTSNHTGRRGTGTQYEPVISLGVGLRVPFSRHFSGGVEVSRLTPFQSGLRARGLYNNGQTVVSAGIGYVF
ncbi:hypothetical protein [Robbsia sp. KACC 23696]|uniref:hypothetical protein n=1 Tax=Robbsia sp. KACC 23696 TaxID=3149231 RepID=UPI00325BC452